MVALSSATGWQLDALSLGTLGTHSTCTDAREDALIRLRDRYPELVALSADEQRLLYAYYCLPGHYREEYGAGGRTVRRWATGLNHRGVAVALGLGARGANRVRRQLLAVYRRIGV